MDKRKKNKDPFRVYDTHRKRYVTEDYEWSINSKGELHRSVYSIHEAHPVHTWAKNVTELIGEQYIVERGKEFCVSENGTPLGTVYEGDIFELRFNDPLPSEKEQVVYYYVVPDCNFTCIKYCDPKETFTSEVNRMFPSLTTLEEVTKILRENLDGGALSMCNLAVLSGALHQFSCCEFMEDTVMEHKFTDTPMMTCVFCEKFKNCQKKYGDLFVTRMYFDDLTCEDFVVNETYTAHSYVLYDSLLHIAQYFAKRFKGDSEGENAE